MKIVFAGTPEFAAQAMRAIDLAGHQIVLVLTQPDRRAGRGMHLHASSVKTFALEKNISVLQPSTLKRNATDAAKKAEAESAYQKLAKLEFDAMVVVAYGLLLPQDVLDLAEKEGRFGCFNIHASLLPRWRGAAPIQRAIEAGDKKTGICIMQMDAGLDTGDVILRQELDIAKEETSASLHDRLADMGASLIVQTLNALDARHTLVKSPQAKDGVSYADKILKSEGEINWQLSANEIDRRIRAFNPFPGASATLGGEPIKILNSALAAQASPRQSAVPGQILGSSETGVYVQCGDGVVELTEVQRPGGKRMNAKLGLHTQLEQKEASRFD
ncbi:methionyl-tRNA formyltransferase [Polynucleobacter paneuropaeus]|uniref:methionyl-tRNA formyltransferase n=1 Tax=Polynucleobacter paneuropaeus TaxID=2527775 RepID=UPI001BFD1F8B|nr:methionyl-tRNA formyltransferase [Polynucleobacter paneuropaeus]QWD50865.1 methionyl-tRNA formyltransferase [Polynucleobacter paneuropaeus]